MAKIDRAAERERLDRIFDEIAGKMPEEPRKTQKEIDEENRRARIDRLSSQEPAEFIASVDDRIRQKATAPDHCWGCRFFTDCSMGDNRNCERWRSEK